LTETAVGSSPSQVFSPRIALAIALVGIFAFSAFVTLLAYAQDLTADPFCRANVYSKCAIGFAGLSEALRQAGEPALVNRTKLPPGRTEGLMVATPEAGGESNITGLGFSGPILVVLPKWATAPVPLRLSWGQNRGLIDPSAMPHTDVLANTTVSRRTGAARPRLTGAAGTPFEGVTLTSGAVERLQSLSAKGWTPVLTDETGAVVMAQAPGTRIFVLAEPDLLDTRGLADADTFAAAAAIVRTLRNGDGPVIFDATLNGYKIDRSALKLMFDPPFLAVTICVAAALALAGWQTLNRFGPVRRAGRAYALGKEGLADNTAQLIRLAGREAKMAPRYAALTRAAVAKALGAPRDLSGEALTGFLDRMRTIRGGGATLAGLTAEAERARDRAQLTAVAQKLYRWRLEMMRERR